MAILTRPNPIFGGRKPRRIPTAVPTGGTHVQQPTTGAGRIVRAPAAPSAGGGLASAKPPPVEAPTPLNMPKIAVNPVNLPSSTASRASAHEQFTGSVADVNTQLQDLARQYGGANEIQQATYTPGGDPEGLGSLSWANIGANQNDPNSALATIAKNLTDQLRFVDKSHIADNSFFTGMRLTEQDQANAAAKDARTKAANDYQTARTGLVSQLGRGQFNLNEAIRAANASDAEASNAAIAAAQAQGPPPPPAASGGPVLKGVPSVSQVPNATLAEQIARFQAARKRNPLGILGR